MESVILTWLSRLFQQLRQVYKDSRFSAFLDSALAWVLGLVSNSLVLGWFATEPDMQAYDNSRFAAMTSDIGQGLRNFYGRWVKPLTEGSLFFRLIDSFDSHFVISLILIGTMVLMPTGLSMVVAFVAVLAYGYQWIKKSEDHHRSPVFILTWAYMVFIVLGTVSALDSNMGLQIGLINLSYLMAVVTIGKGLKSQRNLIGFLGVMMFMAGLSCLFGLYQYVVGVEVDPAWVDEELFDTVSTRVYSFFGNPNVFGLYLVLMAPIAFALTFGLRHWFLRLVSAGIFAASILNIGLTLSRGSMIAIVVAMAIMLVFMDLHFLILGLLSVPLIPFVLPQSIIERLMSIGNMQESSSAYRVSIYMASMNMVRDFLIGGLGMGGFNEVYFTYAFSASKAFHAHNTFLMVLLEHGIFGFIIFMVLLVVWVKDMMSAVFITDNRLYKYLLLAFVGGIAGCSVQGLVEHIWHNYDVMFFYWLIMLLGSGLASMARKEVAHG